MMSVAEHYTDVFADVVLPTRGLLEIHRSKISLHHAKSGYDYPTIRLPHTLSKLVGMSTRIYQTVHDGALAFLVVVSSALENSVDEHESAPTSDMNPVFTRRKSRVQISSSPLFLFPIGGENKGRSRA